MGSGMLWVVGALALALLTESSSRPPFTQYADCASCVGAGFGWSVKKGKCGGYANKDCPPAEQEQQVCFAASLRLCLRASVCLCIS